MKINLTIGLALVAITFAQLSFAREKLVFSSGSNHPMIPISSAILSEAYGRLGIKIEKIEAPVERSLRMANRGTTDGELFRGNISGTLYANLIQVPVVLAFGEVVVFTKNVVFEVTSWESVRPYKIGFRIGIKEVEQNTAGMDVEPVSTNEQIFQKIAAGRNDIGIIPRRPGLLTLKKMGIEGIRILEPPLQRDKLYHYLHKKHKTLLPEITSILKDMETKGLIKKIRETIEADLFRVH